MANLNKLNRIAKQDKKWLKEAELRNKNRHWQKHAQDIAVRILMALKEQNLTQKQLAEKLQVKPQQVNKIVKGKENLTLQSIVKIEETLGIKLVS